MIKRQFNFLGNSRFDVPHAKSLELSAANDFDSLVGQAICGSVPLVIRGFTINPVIHLGQPATTIQVSVANSIAFHPQGSESGTVLTVPANRAIETLNASNSRLEGSFTANVINYLGLDIRRQTDNTTVDTVKFLNPDTKEEISKRVPLARTLDYKLIVSTQDFDTTLGVLPIAKILTDSNNAVVSIVDARDFLFRLASGGTVPNIYNSFSWPNGRSEVATNDDFNAGDRGIRSEKDFNDAIMSRLWEIGGGQQWYSPTADRNVEMTRFGSPFSSTGEYFEWDGSNLHWQGLKFVFDNSSVAGVYYNDVADQIGDSAGLTDLADGDCIYVDIDRTSNRTGGTALLAAKTSIQDLGTPIVPGSRWVIAWRSGAQIYTRNSSFPVGTQFHVATDLVQGTVRLSYAAGTPADPLVPPLNATNGILLSATGAGYGIQATGGSTGIGGKFYGADVAGLPAGQGAYVKGGDSVTDDGGLGLEILGGDGDNGGKGLQVNGGDSVASGSGGDGASIIGGDGDFGGVGATINGGTGVSVDGIGIIASGKFGVQVSSTDGSQGTAIQSNGRIEINSDNPAVSSNIGRTLTKKNIVIAHGEILQGAVVDGFNIHAVADNGSFLDVTLGTTISNDTFTVITSRLGTSVGYSVQARVRDGNGGAGSRALITFHGLTEGGGTTDISSGSVGTNWCFTVYGAQP